MASSITNGTSSRPDSSLPESESNVSTVQTYAKTISSAADLIAEYCTANDLPQPSLRPDAPAVTIPLSAPLAVRDARQRLVDAAIRVQQVVMEPGDYITRLAVQIQLLSCLRWLSHFRILSFIPPHEPITISQLAKTAHVPEHQLRSVIRMAMTDNFLTQPNRECVAHNAASRLFVTDPGFTGWLEFIMKYTMPAATAFADATAKWGATVQKDQTAFNVGLQTEKPFFDFFAQSPELSSQFAAYMRNVQAAPGTSLRHLLTGYDWASVDKGAVVVDVGGSTCGSTIALASTFPDLHFIVQDLPKTTAQSAGILAAQPPSIRSRITTQAHNFFAEQPVRTASVFLLRMILHDWPFSDALCILKNLIPALKKSDLNPPPSFCPRLLVMDTVLSPPGSISVADEALMGFRDLTMMQVLNGRERELGEFEELFAQAEDGEGRLVLKNLVTPPGSVLSVMEVAYELYSRSEGEGGRDAAV